MKRWLLLIFALLLSACASPLPATEEGAPVDLPDLGMAPELVGEVWLNTDAPLRLADLRGKVVLVDMWTFG